MTFFKSKQKLIGSIILLIIVIALCQQFFEENKNDKLLQKSISSFGIIKEIHHGTVHNPKNALIIYRVDSQKYEFSASGDYEAFRIGDTVLIEYAIGDHSVARVKDKYYMKKYHYLKNNDQ